MSAGFALAPRDPEENEKRRGAEEGLKRSSSIIMCHMLLPYGDS